MGEGGPRRRRERACRRPNGKLEEDQELEHHRAPGVQRGKEGERPSLHFGPFPSLNFGCFKVTLVPLGWQTPEEDQARQSMSMDPAVKQTETSF